MNMKLTGHLRRGGSLLCLVLALILTGCAGKSPLDPKDPVSLTVWHYYNGSQQAAFDALVEEFNDSVGRERGIYVQSYSQGSVSDLEAAVRDAIRKAIPEAEEKISWSMPTFWKGHNIIHFAGFKNHVGLYPGTEAVEEFADRLKDCKTSKGSIQFLYSRPIPLELIADIARWCYKTGKHP